MKTNDVHLIKLGEDKPLSLKGKIRKKIRDIFPYVRVHDVDEYFALPKSKREKWGIYLKPLGLPCDFLDEDVKGWNHFDKEIRKQYPVQGWFREWLFSVDNPVYWFFVPIKRNLSDVKYAIKHFIKPAHPRFHKAYPRHKWNDISYAIVSVNFAMIQDFYHEEISLDIVNWDSTPEHKKFREWLDKAIHWIEKAKPQAEKDVDVEYKKIDHKDKSLTYEQKYGKIHEIERLIEDTDTRILKEMVEFRGFFWT
jgi:hypothetical protein